MGVAPDKYSAIHLEARYSYRFAPNKCKAALGTGQMEGHSHLEAEQTKFVRAKLLIDLTLEDPIRCASE